MILSLQKQLTIRSFSLASVFGREHHKWLWRLSKGRPFWIGLNAKHDPKTWEYVGGGPVAFSRWSQRLRRGLVVKSTAAVSAAASAAAVAGKKKRRQTQLLRAFSEGSHQSQHLQLQQRVEHRNQRQQQQKQQQSPLWHKTLERSGRSGAKERQPRGGILRNGAPSSSAGLHPQRRRSRNGIVTLGSGSYLQGRRSRNGIVTLGTGLPPQDSFNMQRCALVRKAKEWVPKPCKTYNARFICMKPVVRF